MTGVQRFVHLDQFIRDNERKEHVVKSQEDVYIREINKLVARVAALEAADAKMRDAFKANNLVERVAALEAKTTIA